MQKTDIDQVADADTERNAGCVEQFGNGAPGHVIDLLVMADLGIAKDDGGELIRLGRSLQGEIDRCRQRTRGGSAFVKPGGVEPVGAGHVSGQILGRALRPVHVVEPGQVVLRHRRRPTGRFDDEQHVAVRDAQAISAVGIGSYDIAAIRDQHAGDAPGAGGADAAAGRALEHHSCGHLGGFGRRGERFEWRKQHQSDAGGNRRFQHFATGDQGIHRK